MSEPKQLTPIRALELLREVESSKHDVPQRSFLMQRICNELANHVHFGITGGKRRRKKRP